MSKLRITILLALITTGCLFAQPTPRSGAQTTPSSSPARPATETRQSAPPRTETRTESRSSNSPSNTTRYQNPKMHLPPSAQDRSTASPNTRSDTRSSTSGSTRMTPNTSNVPTTGTGATGPTPRGVPRSDKKIAPLAPSESVKVNWMTLEQALEKNKTEKRKFFIEVYTDWCGWCKKMDSTTFVKPAVVAYLNANYYPVKFNAEQTQDVEFNGKTYHFKSGNGRGAHELASQWLNNRFTYPTMVFLDENLNVIQPLPGYQESTKMEAILNYFGTNSHKKTPWESYEKKFSSQ